jgi:hypothetical protein
MMLIDPEQPTQPDVVSRDAFIDASVQGVIGLSQLDVIAIRRGAGVGVLVCEPFCLGDIDEALLGAFAVGAGFGIGTAAGTIDDRGWRLHEGAIQPFKERAPALKYGGAALAAAGAIVTALWSHVPVANSVAVSPAVGGFRISASIGF